MLTVRSILCPVDLSEQSRHALLWASAIAQYRGGEMTVLSTGRRLEAGDLASDISVPLVLAHVVAPVVVPPRWQALVADFESDRMASGQRMLARLSASFRETHNDCVVSVGRPADTIASLAVEHGADLVVMGLANPDDSEPRNPGSIAYRVLRIAHVAVVVVPALRRTPSARHVEPGKERLL